MPYTITQNDYLRARSMTSELKMDFNNVDMNNFDIHTKNLNSTSPIDRIVLRETAPNINLFRIVEKDGRIWSQTLDFQQSQTDPKIFFNVQGGWKLSEFIHIREIRNALIGVRNTYKVTEMVCDWK